MNTTAAVEQSGHPSILTHPQYESEHSSRVLTGHKPTPTEHPQIIAVDQLPDSLNSIARYIRSYESWKRCADIVVSLILLFLLVPVFIAISVVILCTSKGPILFKQTRLGRYGSKFSCYKFRSMVADAESALTMSPELESLYQAQGFKLKSDPRVTKFGAFLRKTSLDELPQLINVLMGDISMIGPRPIVPSELKMYGKFANKFLAVPPGLSGMWQAFGRSDTTYSERVELDMIYIDRRSLWLDFVLAIKTISSVTSGRGAH